MKLTVIAIVRRNVIDSVVITLTCKSVVIILSCVDLLIAVIEDVSFH